MTSKTKKARAAGRFGARYGKRAKSKLSDVEEKQRKKQKCPYCGKKGAKRLSTGIWKCSRKKCGKKFASDAYYL
ncbi:MAG: 50S ribosomal protein L37ae [Candidatus Pacearchaeota archaeon]